MDLRVFGQNVRRRRERLGIPRHILAEKVHCDTDALMEIEHGRRKRGPAISLVADIAKELNTTVNDLLAGT